MSYDLEALANEAKNKAYCPKSHHPVGCAGIGRSGAVYLGCNVELPHATQHAEQVMMAQAALAGDVVERVYLTCSPCGNCRQALYEHDMHMCIDWPEASSSTMWALDILPGAYERKNDYMPPTYVQHDNLLIDAANKALSTCQAYRSGIAEACAIEARFATRYSLAKASDGRIFAAARNEWCSYPGDAFTLAFGAMILTGRLEPREVYFSSCGANSQPSFSQVGPLMSIARLWPKCNILFDGVRWDSGIIAGMALYRAMR